MATAAIGAGSAGIVAQPKPRAAQSARPARYDHDKQFAHYRQDIEQKLAEAKRTLGDKLTCHPNYQHNPRHSVRFEIWSNARAPHWEFVARAAAEARERNPAYHQAQRAIRALIDNYPQKGA